MNKILITVALILTSLFSFGQGIPDAPVPARLVNDFANVFTAEQTQALENKLVRFDSKTSTQIAVVTLTDLSGYESIDMATRIQKEWGVGGKEDNGIVIVFKPKVGNSQGQVAIATGYGVEHLVTDALGKKIVEYDMIPVFKTGDNFAGIVQGVSVLMDLTAGEYTGTNYLEKHKGKRKSGGSGFFFLIFFILPIIMRISGGRKYGQYSSRGSSLPFWLLLGAASGSRHGGSYGNFSSGGGSFGGGFGGFGGGMGGGGGASGSW